MARIPASERRAELIDAAIRVIARDGLAHATTRAIVAEAGMSLASFHYAFASRDELLDEVIRTVIAREQQAVVPEQIETDDLPSILEAGLLRYFEHLRGDPDHELAMFELALTALRTPERRELAVAQYARYVELASEALELAATVANVRWREPVADVARVLVAFTDGLTTTWLVDRDDGASRRVARAAADVLSRMAEPA